MNVTLRLLGMPKRKREPIDDMIDVVVWTVSQRRMALPNALKLDRRRPQSRVLVPGILVAHDRGRNRV